MLWSWEYHLNSASPYSFPFVLRKRPHEPPRLASSSLQSPVFSQTPHNLSLVRSSGVPHAPPSLALNSCSMKEEWVFCCQDLFRPQCHQWVLLTNATTSLVLPEVGGVWLRFLPLYSSLVELFWKRTKGVCLGMTTTGAAYGSAISHVRSNLYIVNTIRVCLSWYYQKYKHNFFKPHLSSFLLNFIGFAASLKMVICSLVSK